MCLTFEAVLAQYDLAIPLMLACDASPRGMSVILSHIHDGNENPIIFKIPDEC